MQLLTKSTTCLIPVQKQHYTHDSGIDVLKYVLSVLSEKHNVLSQASFDNESYKRHFATLCEVDESKSSLLRREILTLVINVATKHARLRVLRDHRSDDQDRTGPQVSNSESSFCGSNTVDSDESSNSALMRCESDSDYAPEDDDIEVDDAESLCGKSENENMIDKIPPLLSRQKSNIDHGEETSTTDDSAECSKDPFFRDGLQRDGPHSHYCSQSRELESNLLCPGDIVEYRDVHNRNPTKRDSISTISDTKEGTTIQLKSGCVLRPNFHIVRKVKMLCGATDNFISNPLAKWYAVEKCILQSGSVDCAYENFVSDSECDETSSRSNSITFNEHQHNDNRGLRKKRCRQERKRKRTSEGLTKNKQTLKMRQIKKWNKHMDSIMPWPEFKWCDKGGKDYYDAIEQINDKYKKMLKVGKSAQTVEQIQSMMCAETKKDFQKIRNCLQDKFTRHMKAGKSILENFHLCTELLPDPRKYLCRSIYQNPRRLTNRQRIAKEQILTFEHYLSSLNILKCSICLECHIEDQPARNENNFTCNKCSSRKDPNFFLDNNLHPVWYAIDNDGNYDCDENGNKIPQFHIPEELACLTMAEKLLIRRAANMVPSVHIRNGIFGLKGHCVTFPQDISQMCDELPQRKETIVTFIRNIANKETSKVYPTSLKVNRNRVVTALLWLKKHNPFYRNISIQERNFDWMKGMDEANIAIEGTEMNMKHTASSKLIENEEEYISKCHAGLPDEDEDDDNDGWMPLAGMHANDKSDIPSGREAQPIKELVDIAKETGQLSKVMQFPSIDHDSAIS